MTDLSFAPLLWLYNGNVDHNAPHMVPDSLTLIELDAVDSTNSWLIAQSRLAAVQLPCAVIAREQTNGRGRMGRSWVAHPDTSLCLSVAVQLSSAPGSWLSLAVGVSVLEWLCGQGVSQVGLKWPNDLMVGNAKLGGILCESVSSSAGFVLVMGLGLNVKPVDSENPSISLEDLGLSLGPERLSEIGRAIAMKLVTDIDLALRGGFASIVQQFRQNDIYLGQEIKVIDGGKEIHRGRAAGISEEGAYLIETELGLVAIQSGDLSIRQVSDE